MRLPSSEDCSCVGTPNLLVEALLFHPSLNRPIIIFKAVLGREDSQQLTTSTKIANVT